MIMNFCPNCGAKLIEGAKFCSNCGFDLSSVSLSKPVEAEPTSVVKTPAESASVDAPRNARKQRPRDESEPNDETPDADQPNLEEKYATELGRAKDKKICAVDGAPIGFMSGRVCLSDGYYICEKHFRQVFLGWPNANDELPSLIEFLEPLNNPDHVKALLPSAQARENERKRLAEIHHQEAVERLRQREASANYSAPAQKTYSGGLRCPRCKSANVQLISADANVKKVKHTTSVNLNPLHPLTMMNHNEKVVKKHSAGKIAAGIMTGGASLLVTGTHSNAAHEYHCQDCGKVWTAK